MKNIHAASVVLVSLCAMAVTSIAGLPDAPIEFRFARLGDILRRFNTADRTTSIVAGRLMAGGMAYALSWDQPVDLSDAQNIDLSPPRVVNIAVDALKEKLPEGLRPEASTLLGIGKYQITDSKTTIKWVWIAEFRVNDESPVAGTGFMPTLFVPISTNGVVLLNVKRVEN